MHILESGGVKVYTDMVVTFGRNIAAISIIGQDISIKSIRAEFMDSSAKRQGKYYWLHTENEKYTQLVKPPATYQQLPQVKTEQGLQVFLLQENLLWGLSKKDMRVRAYQRLQELNIPSPTPVDQEFSECMDRIIQAGETVQYFKKCDVKSPHLRLQAAKFYLTDRLRTDQFQKEAEIIIASYLDQDQDFTPEEMLDGIEGIADYIERYAQPIGDKVSKRVKYLHMPGEYQNEFFDKLGRKLFPQQKDISVAAAKSMADKGYAIVSGQMGVGKTTIGVAACHYDAGEKPYRTIVTCPGHLVEKWAREIETVIPKAKIYLFGEKHKPWEDFYHQWRQADKLEEPEYWIVSNEALRGGYIQSPGVLTRKRKAWDAEFDVYRMIDVAVCPKCGQTLQQPVRIDGETFMVDMTPADFKVHSEKNHRCRNLVTNPVTQEDEVCGEMLWQADNNRKGYRKVSIADIIKKRIPNNFFTYYIADEVHKYKGSTAQGLGFGGVISKVKKVVAMTGTLADGYANGLYYLLWRLDPVKFKAKGFKHDEESRTKFQNEYGFWLKTIKSKGDGEYGASSRAKNAKVQVKPLPGYTINTFPEWLIERTCFLKLSDVAPFLPPKNEYVNVVEMDEELANHYHDLEDRLRHEIREGGSQVASIMFHTCLSFPDIVDGQEAINVVKPDYSLYLPIPQMDRNKVYNKEKELQEILKAELELGRKCLVFTTYTNNKDHIPRLEWVSSQVPGARIQSLRSTTTTTKKREAWVKNKANNEGINVLICHPELVETGLDLLEFQTIIWMQTGYIPATVRQASSRSWRIGQTEPIKVIFLCYQDTLQEKCFQLIGSKLNAAGILEGNLSNEGLRNFGQDDSMFNDILSLLKDNIVAMNSNDIFEKYKAEVAHLLDKPVITQKEIIRLMTLAETLAKNNVDLSRMTARQKRQIERNKDQLVLFA